MFNIVLIDDDEEEIPKIRLTIKDNAPASYMYEKHDYDFVIFPLNKFASEQAIINYLINLIRSKDVSMFIIDYKLLTQDQSFEGTKIFAEINKMVPKFPNVILTERFDDSLGGFFVDADKIYEKSRFFQVEEQYSKQKVSNLFYNMESYSTNLHNLESKLNNLVAQLGNKISPQVIYEINNIEDELSNYIPLDHSQAEKLYDASKLKEVVSLLTEANNLILGQKK